MIATDSVILYNVRLHSCIYVYAFTYCIRYLYVHTSLCVVAMFMCPNAVVHDSYRQSLCNRKTDQ